MLARYDLNPRLPETLNLTRRWHCQIEAQRSERRSPFPEGKGEEEDRFGKVAASQNSKFQADGGINTKKSAIPLIFLHGFLGNAQDWIEVASELSTPCIAFDLPGHGASPFTEDFSSAFANATQEFASFHLIGYSMGGRLAAQFAENFPEKIVKLTLISAHLGLKTEEEKKNRYEKDLQLAHKIQQVSLDEFLKEWYNQPLFQPLLKKRDILSMRSKQDREGLAQALAAFSLGKQKRLQPKGQFLVGEDDEKYRAYYREIPHTLIPRAGHAAHLENPIGVARNL